MMVRSLLIGIVCTALAFVGIAGTHEHIHAADGGPAFEHEHHDDHAADVFTLLSADHQSSHDAQGGIDHDPDAKSAAKVFSGKAQFILAFVVAILGLLARQPLAFVRRCTGCLRPRSRGSFYLHPPSHAPPIAA